MRYETEIKQKAKINEYLDASKELVAVGELTQAKAYMELAIMLTEELEPS